MLYPREDKEHRQLMYACRNCDHKQIADNPCIYVNKLMHEVEYVFLWISHELCISVSSPKL